MVSASAEIRGIVFDLDGTLYVCDRFATEIHNAAAAYVAGVTGTSRSDAAQQMSSAREKLVEEYGTVPTLSAICTKLGGNVQGLHRFFEHTLRPEAYLVRDERIIRLLQNLADRFPLYIYTNNNRVLTARIIDYLGLDNTMRGIFTIDDTWRSKPDEGMVNRVLTEIGLPAGEVLFVGDRYDVDLRVPEQLGCPVYLSQSLDQLLKLEKMLVRSLP